MIRASWRANVIATRTNLQAGSSPLQGYTPPPLSVDGRLDALTGEVETLGRETRELRTELPAQVVAGVLVGFERSAFATDLRTLQAEVAELKADMAELKRASGE